jgi:tetratricopeptide (TPR) repeat protein
LLRNSAQYRSEAFCRALLESVREVIFDDPKESLARAEHALELSEGLAGIGVSEPGLADFKARAWMELGNARRVVSDFPGAHQAFQQAQKQLLQGSGDPRDEAAFARLVASLLKVQKKPTEGLVWVERALRVEKQIGDRHAVGRCMMLKSMLLYDSHEPELALKTIERALEYLDPLREPNVYLGAAKNVALFLEALGRPEEALERIRSLRPAFDGAAGRTLRLNLGWIEGRLAGRAGDLRAAEAAFQRAMLGFAELGNFHDSAQAALELANLYLEAGRTVDVGRLAAWAHRTFSACGIDREAVAALVVWSDAARTRTVTASMLASLQTVFQRQRGRQAPIQ